MAKQEITRVEPTQSPIMQLAEMANRADGKIDVSSLKELLDCQERYEANEARKAYHAAMAEFQSEAPKIIKQKSGHNNKYAGLSDIVAVIAPLESKYGLSHSWVTGTSDKEIKVICKITHVLGHREETELSAGPDKSGNKNDIQALGSTITYLQRYTLKAALGLAEADQDDDGNGTGDNAPKITPPTQQEQKVLDCVRVKIVCPPGMRVDEKKMNAILIERAQRYPDEMEKVDKVAKWLSDMNRPELFIPETRSQFEIDQDLPGDEDSEPDEQPDVLYRCQKCGLEFPTPKQAAECIC